MYYYRIMILQGAYIPFFNRTGLGGRFWFGRNFMFFSFSDFYIGYPL